MIRITLVFLFASFQMLSQTPKIGIDEHDYSTTKFQDADLHKLEHKHHGYK